jgi:3-hydroxyisobutyrate dehydrogenase-like beta-hydroxyacid dehydrogenase
MAVVGLVGVGLLGHAVAGRLLGAGHQVVGHDIVPERVEALVALGGKGARSVREVTASAGMVCTLLPSLAAVEHAILGPDGVLAGLRLDGVVVQMSTISPALTERLDCPVSGTSAQVARGDGILMVGGDVELYQRWRPVLESILPRSYHVGAAGQAMLLKLVANLLVALNSAAAAEALTLARKGGLDPARALEVLTASAATSRMLEVRGPLMVRGAFAAQMKLDLFMKDLHLIQDAGRAAEAALPLTAVAERLRADGG